MAVLSIPNVFVTGTTINAGPFNTNFSAVQTAVNSIDNSNIGSAGLYASQLLPTSAAQATFGGTLGYTFLAPSTGTTPLTVSGIAGQSADIFDVTLTNGGTKAFSVSAAGAVALLSTLFVPTSITTPIVTAGSGGLQLQANNTTIQTLYTNGQAGFGGPVFGSSIFGSAAGFYPPVYAPGGTAVGSTTHIVQGSGTSTGSGQVIVNLTGTAQFSSFSSYIIVAYDLTAQASISPVVQSATTFTLQAVSGINGHLLVYAAIGS